MRTGRLLVPVTLKFPNLLMKTSEDLKRTCAVFGNFCSYKLSNVMQVFWSYIRSCICLGILVRYTCFARTADVFPIKTSNSTQCDNLSCCLPPRFGHKHGTNDKWNRRGIKMANLNLHTNVVSSR